MKGLLTSALVFLSLLVFGQANVSFHYLNVENGLSQSSVLSIAQDSKGFMWFGTRAGLNKYDSRNFKIYLSKSDDKYSLSSSSYISSLLCAKNGSLWIGSSFGLTKYNEQNDNFDRIAYDKNRPDGICSSRVTSLYEDTKGRVWVATRDGLNLLVSEKDYKFKHFFTGKSLQSIMSLTEDHNGVLWVGTSAGLFNLTFKGSKPIIRYFEEFSERIKKEIDNPITTMIEDREGNLWIGTKQTGLIRYNLKSGVFTYFSYSSLNANGISSNNIRKIILDKEGNLWIASLHGINVYNTTTEKFTVLQNQPDNPYSLVQNSVYDLYQDKQGIIWAATYFGGINLIYPNYTPFKIYKSANTNKGLSSNVIGPIAEDGNHNLWIGTEAEGLNYFDRKTNTFTHFKYNPNDGNSLGSNLVKAIFRDKKNRIWVGTHLGGLNLFQPESKNFIRYTSKKNDTSSLSSAEVTAVLEDSFGRFWVGTTRGLNQLNTKTGKFSAINMQNRNAAISFIYEDCWRNIWIASNADLFYLANGSKELISYEHTKKRVKSLPRGGVNCITQDKANNLLFGTTKDGLFKVDTKKNTYKKIDKKNGLPSNNIVGVLEDENGNLWISTDNGLSKYSIKTNLCKNYNVKDGLPGNEFNYKSFLKDSKGELFFGGLGGLISFFPSQILENKIVPKAVITGLKLFNKPVLLNDESGLLTTNISNLNSLTFKSSQNVFTIDFAILNFIKPNKNKYAYKLKGFEKNWNYVDIPSASYTNLSPGNYELLVKGSNNDGVWTSEPASIFIKILPPFYRTWWAYIFYLIIIAAVSVISIRYLLIRAVLKKEKEINEHKLEFFTNISHEIRTPLTLIVGPLEKLLANSLSDPELNRDLQPIKNNADRLMNLVTELLDFRKAESGKMKLQVSPNNLIGFCKEIFLAFQNMSIGNEVEYIFDSNVEEVEAYFDKIQLEKVLFNLLSNAFKFTTKGGEIKFEIEDDSNFVNIKITDNGKGIAKENQSNLFKDFYQANPSNSIGTGLGLSLSKSIVELHKGEITFQSTAETSLQRGDTYFKVRLRKGQSHFDKSDFNQVDSLSTYKLVGDINFPELPAPKTKTELNTTSEIQKPTLLLVEDNLEIRIFIKDALSDDYAIYECEDGLQGLKIVFELIPDLIVSDVMMPNMDGLEMCRNIKTDERTSHIPVILLTARSAYIHQVNGLETGADAYIVKPFNLKILKLTIANLVNARKAIKRKFGSLLIQDTTAFSSNTTDQNFLVKIIQIIENHLSDTNFGVPVLASEIGMSQPVLYKKIRALADSSVNDFIKSIRLKKAVELLKLNQGNISEIAYSVGFSDRKYFSIEFKKQFGESPTEFKQKFNNTTESN